MQDERKVRRRWYQLALASLSLIAWLFGALSASYAHHTSIGNVSGIPIPSLTHGQLAVIAENRDQILALADRQPFSDETFYRLRNFGDLQYLNCLWGMVPGSLTDEESPFNECSHAYLSAAQALMLHMRGMKGDQTAVKALISRIELQMLANNASLVLCRYSDEPFNTADVIEPRWREVAFHLPSLLSFICAGSLIIGCFGLFVRYLLTPSKSAPREAEGSPA